MSKKINLNVFDLVRQLERMNLIDNAKEIGEFVIAEHVEKSEVSLYKKILIAVFAFLIALWCAMIIELFVKSANGVLVCGIICIISATILRRKFLHTANLLILYSSVLWMWAGKLAVVMSLHKIYHSFFSLYYLDLLSLLLTAMTYYVYPVWIDRFLSALFTLGLIMLTFIIEPSSQLAFNFICLIKFVCIGYLLYYNTRRDYLPLLYAFIISLAIDICCMITTRVYNIFFMKICLSIGLISLFVWISGGIGKVRCKALAFVVIGICALGFVSTSGVLLAIGCMVIGCAKDKCLLSIFGGIFLSVFLLEYYYNLNVSLLQKSYILIGSGLVLLLSRLCFNYYMKEEVCVQS